MSSRKYVQNTRCGPDKCTDNEYVQKDGTCKKCDDYTHPADTINDCVADVCTGRQILNINGKCEECGEYTLPNHERKKCVNICKANQNVNEDGSCSDITNTNECPEFTRR